MKLRERPLPQRRTSMLAANHFESFIERTSTRTLVALVAVADVAAWIALLYVVFVIANWGH